MRAGRLVVVGDALLDRELDGRVDRLCPDAPVPVLDVQAERARAGGAGLAAALLAGDGRRVTLVTALADDAPGRRLAGLLAAAGVEVVDLGLAGATPEKVRARAEGRSLLRLDHGGPPSDVGEWTEAADRSLAGAAAVLVSDYGRGLAAAAGVRAALGALPSRTPVVWDPHPRGAPPVPGARLATPNRSEAAAFAPEVVGDGLAACTARARALVARWRAAAVAVTLGDKGALLATDGDAPPLVVPAAEAGNDPCGAGDRFASAAAGLLADGALPTEAVTAAVAAASAFVAAGGASTLATDHTTAVPAPPIGGHATGADGADGAGGDAGRVVAAVRAAGGTVVAAGGCFDLLHAGHVRLLEAARSLGDCLVVCMNSDASVRRLKGPGRPVVPQADRVALLLALECVDAVAVFDEPTPLAVLDRLRPDVFAKGGDYGGADLPEAGLLAEWGGQAVVLPYLQGRSTTRLVEEVSARART